ncbi:hypothetical protein RQP46_003147 [Phenoliferia psychrophenolica]
MLTTTLKSLLFAVLATRIYAGDIIDGFEGADCTGAVIRSVNYASGAGCHCDYNNQAKSVSFSGDAAFFMFPTSEPNVCNRDFALNNSPFRSDDPRCFTAPAGVNIACVEIL